MKNRKMGIFCILTAAFSFSCMDALVQMAGDIPPLQKVFFRNLIALVVTSVMLFHGHISVRVARSSWRPLFFRCLFGMLGVSLEFFAIEHMLLADAVMLNKMSPFFAVIFSVFLLKEKLRLPQLGLFCTAMLGCLCILRPSFSGFASPYALIGLASGICAGLAYTEVRVLGNQNIHRSAIIFYFSAFSCLSTLPSIVLDYAPMTIRQMVMLLLIGVAGLCGQFSITAAYCYAPAKEISVYDYSQILFTALLGYLLFRELPDWLSLLGYFTICASAFVMTLYNLHDERHGKPSEKEELPHGNQRV